MMAMVTDVKLWYAYERGSLMICIDFGAVCGDYIEGATSETVRETRLIYTKQFPSTPLTSSLDKTPSFSIEWKQPRVHLRSPSGP